MKPTNQHSSETHSKSLGVSLAFCASIALTATPLLADRGVGSIRAAARPAPEVRAAPAREAPVREAPVREAPVREAPVREAPEREAPGRPEIHEAPPRVVAPARRDWDENDEDRAHFGGFARGAPVRIVRGTRVHDLPPRHFDIPFHDHHYFFDPVGVFYLADPDGQYEVVEPPIGIDINALPDGADPIEVGGVTYYYLDGVFYAPQGDGFVVVAPPPGIIVPTLPDGATQTEINGTVVYQFNGYNYSPTIQDGVTAYVVTPS